MERGARIIIVMHIWKLPRKSEFRPSDRIIEVHMPIELDLDPGTTETKACPRILVLNTSKALIRYPEKKPPNIELVITCDNLEL